MEVTANSSDQTTSVFDFGYAGTEYWPVPASVQPFDAQLTVEDHGESCESHFVDLTNVKVDRIYVSSDEEDAAVLTDHDTHKTAYAPAVGQIKGDHRRVPHIDKGVEIVVSSDEEEEENITCTESVKSKLGSLSTQSQHSGGCSQGQSVSTVPMGKSVKRATCVRTSSVHSGFATQENASQPVGSAFCAPFPLLLQSADGSFMCTFSQHFYNPHAPYPVSLGAGRAPTQTVSLLAEQVLDQCNTTAPSPTVMHIPAHHTHPVVCLQQSDRVFVPCVLQGQPKPVYVSIKSQSQSLYPNISPKRKAQKRKDPAFSSCGQSWSQSHNNSKGHGSPISRKMLPKAVAKKRKHGIDDNRCPSHNKNNQHRKALGDVNKSSVANRVDITPSISRSCEQELQLKLPKSKVKKGATALSDDSIVRQKKARPTSKLSHGRKRKKSKPHHYYPAWPAVEEEKDDTCSMEAFFKSIRTRRGDKRRFTSKELEEEREKETEEKLRIGCEDGLKVISLEGKGRGVVASKVFEKDEFVVEYAGELINITTANQREDLYERDEKVGCYMYYFSHKGKHYCIDATTESGKLGRLLNHSRKGNCHTKVVVLGGIPRLVLLASQRIEEGEELTYDYGDRSTTAIENHPWLKN